MIDGGMYERVIFRTRRSIDGFGEASPVMIDLDTEICGMRLHSVKAVVSPADHDGE